MTYEYYHQVKNTVIQKAPFLIMKRRIKIDTADLFLIIIC